MEGTQNSTPAETISENTSQNVELESSNTSTGELSEGGAAESETKNEEGNKEPSKTLYCGKFKTVEDLVKGYENAESFIGKNAELEKQIKAMNEEKEKAILKAQQERLEQAQLKGFKTPEEQEIAERIQLNELEQYVNNLSMLNPNVFETARAYLQQYYNTGVQAYLDEAKNYFPSSVIENITLQKSMFENKLRGQFAEKQAKEKEKIQTQLAETIKTNFSDFLSDLGENKAKYQALQVFCESGQIQSEADMQNFVSIFNSVFETAKKQAIDEYKAQQTIDETKQNAQISTGGGSPIGGDSMPTAEDISRMTQEQYNAACKKYGAEKLLKQAFS